MCDKKAEEKKPAVPLVDHQAAFSVAISTATDSNLARAYLDLRRMVFAGRAVVADFLPNVAVCVLQDYGRLNNFMLETDRLWACSNGQKEAPDHPKADGANNKRTKGEGRTA